MTMPSTPANFWTKVIAPHPSLTSIEQRHPSQLLSLFSLTLPLFLILLPLHQVFTIGLPSEVRVFRALASLIFSIALAAILNTLNHAGKYKLSAYGLVFIFFGASNLPLVAAPLLSANEFEPVFYMCCMIFFGAIFSGWRAVFIMVLISIGLHLQFFATMPLFSVAIFAIGLWLYGLYRDTLDQACRAEIETALAELRQREEHFQIVSELMSDFAYCICVNPDKTMSSEWNTGTFKQLNGFFPQEIIKEGTSSTVSALTQSTDVQVQADIINVIQGNPVSREYPYVDKNGDTHWIHLDRHPIWDEAHQRVIRYYGVAHDITVRKKAEEALAKERNLLRTVIDHIPDHIYVKDRQGRFLVANAASLASIGLMHEEDLIGKTDGDFFPPTLAEAWHTQELAIMEAGQGLLDAEAFQPWHMDIRRWVMESLIPLRDQQGDVICIVGVSRDITDRKRAEEALRESEEKFRTVFETAPTSIAITTTEGRFVDANPAFLDLVGMRLDQLVGHDPIELGLVQDPDAVAQLTASGQENGQTINLEIVAHHADGRPFSYLYSTQPLQLGGQPHFLTLGIDITDRKRAEEHEQALARNLRAVVDAADELIAIQDFNLFYRRAVELAREKLKIERCALFLLDSAKQSLIGTYGTDAQGDTTDETWVKILTSARHHELLARTSEPWIVEEANLTAIDERELKIIGTGWVVTTPVRIGDEPIGLFSNDAAISGEPLDTAQQEALALYCSLLGNIIARRRIEEDLRESEQRFRAIFEATPNGIGIVRQDNAQYVTVNQAFLDEIGLPREQVLGRTALELGLIRDPVQLDLMTVNTNRMHYLTNHALTLYRADGRPLDILFTTWPLVLKSKPHTVNVHINVTTLNEAEAARRLSERRYRWLAENLPESVVLLFDRDLRFVLVDGPEVTRSGYSKSYMEGKTLFEAVSPEFAQAVEPNMRAVLDGKIFSAEVPFDDQMYLYNYAPLRDDQGVILYGLIVGQNITARKRIEVALRESEQRFRTIFDSAPNGIVITDMAGHYTAANQTFLDEVGLRLDQVLGRNAFEIGLISHKAQFDQMVQGWSANEGITHQEMAVQRADGRPYDIFYSNRRLDLSGLPHILTLSVDITDRKQAEAALQHSEEMARQFQEALKMLHEVNLELTRTDSLDELCRLAVALGRSRLDFDRLGIWLYNPMTETMHGTFGTDEAGTTLDERNETRIAKNNPLIRAALQGEHPVVLNDFIDVLLPDGAIALVEGWTAHASMWNGNQIVGYVSADNLIRHRPVYPYQSELLSLFGTMIGHLYARKQIESAERTQRQFAEALRDTASVLSATLNLKEVLHHILQSLGKIMRQDTATILLIENEWARVVSEQGYTERGLTDAILGTRLPLAATVNLRQMLETQQPFVIPRVEGFEGWQLLPATAWIKSQVGAPIQIEGQTIGFLSLESETVNTFNAEDAVRLKAFADQAAIAIRNARFYDTVLQYAEELEIRVEERTSQFKAANQELEAFAYSVSHDLRAPLRAMDGFARTLMQDYSAALPEKGQHYLNRIQQNAKRMGMLIDDLLTLSRVGRKELKKELVNVNTLLQTILAELAQDHQIGAAEIVIHDLPPSNADEILLSQVWYNLVTNAIKYSKKKDHPRIEIGYQAETETAGRYFIKDNGVGFDMRYVDKLFGVFQRLHSIQDYEGTGIGLAIVQRIIHRHGGKVWAEAVIDQGATFYFTLP